MRLGIASGIFTVFWPPPASTRMYWPLASPERLSDAIPLSPYAVSSNTRPNGWCGYWLPGATGSTVSFDHGITTSLKHDERLRAWSRNGTVRCASWASSGIVGRRSATRPRSSRSETSARTWSMNGVAARSVAGRRAHAGQRLAGEGAQRRERRV